MVKPTYTENKTKNEFVFLLYLALFFFLFVCNVW